MHLDDETITQLRRKRDVPRPAERHLLIEQQCTPADRRGALYVTRECTALLLDARVDPQSLNGVELMYAMETATYEAFQYANHLHRSRYL